MGQTTKHRLPSEHLQRQLNNICIQLAVSIKFVRVAKISLPMSPIRILRRDSLTWGWTMFGIDARPYAGALVTALKKRISTTSISADVQGLPGDQVVSPPGGFVRRVNILCR